MKVVDKLVYKDECYQIVGVCMEIHSLLDPGLLEIVYKDAMEYEFKQKLIPYEREKRFDVHYKNIVLPHNFYADFVAYGGIILEVKAVSEINKEHAKQAQNYSAISRSPLALILNFGSNSFEYKRIVN